MAAERRKLRFDDWDDVLRDLVLLQERGYAHAAHGKLSLGQISVHLAKVLRGALDGYPRLFPWPLRMIARLLFLNSMLRHQPTRMRLKAPASLAPPDEVDDADGVQELREAIERFRNHSGEYAPHVVFGQLTRDQYKHQQLWHCEHHLSFLLPR